MPKYKAKPVEVDAWKIHTVIPSSARVNTEHLMLGISATILCEGGNRFEVDQFMTARYFPVVGDYIVQQADGYLYVNPKEVFERKYEPAA